MSFSLLGEILELDVAERIRLLEVAWDSIAADPDAVPLTQAQKEELDSRLGDYHRDPSPGSSWEDVRKRITDQP